MTRRTLMINDPFLVRPSVQRKSRSLGRWVSIQWFEEKNVSRAHPDGSNIIHRC
jgi:hypothetical protein